MALDVVLSEGKWVGGEQAGERVGGQKKSCTHQHCRGKERVLDNVTIRLPVPWSPDSAEGPSVSASRSGPGWLASPTLTPARPHCQVGLRKAFAGKGQGAKSRPRSLPLFVLRLQGGSRPSFAKLRSLARGLLKRRQPPKGGRVSA